MAVGVLYGFSRYFVVTHIHMEMSNQNHEVQNQEVLDRLKSRLNRFVGRSMLTLQMEEIRKVLHSELHSHSENAKVLRDWSGRRFVISLQPLKVQALLWKNAQEFYPLSGEARLLPPVSLSQLPDVPVLRGRVFLKEARLRKQVLRFLNLLPEENKHLSKAGISEITYSQREKSLWLVLSAHSGLIKTNSSYLKTKTAQRIESVLQYLKQQNIKWRVIDARFSQKIVVSREEDI